MRVIPLIPLVLLGVATAAAPASAATVEVTTPCVVYVSDYGDPAMQIVGSGFLPGTLVKLGTTTEAEPTPKPLETVRAGLLGNISTESGAAFFDSEETQDQQFTLIATAGVVTTSTTFRQVRRGYVRRPKASTPGARVKHIARGFTPGNKVWAHFRHKHKTRATKQLGVAHGPCGIAKRKMRALPATPRIGTWRVVVDEHKVFDLDNTPQARLTFVIKPK
jgi:hypothetical protein